MATWEHVADLNSWTQDQQQQSFLATNKRSKRDNCYERSGEQECGWALRVPATSIVFDESFEPETSAVKSSDPRFYMDDADASVVTSSCHFSLSDAGIGLFEQASSCQKELDGSWDNLNSLEDIFGNSSSFLPQNSSFEADQSVSSSSPDSAMTVKFASSGYPGGSPRKEDDNISSLLASSVTETKPEYWLGQDSQTSIRCHGDYQPATAVISTPTPGLLSEITSLQTSGKIAQQQQTLQQLQVQYKAFAPELQQEPDVLNLVIRGQLEQQADPLATSSSGEGSLEAQVLHQLGSTMSKLDVGTRLCFRNALYRLAQSASQRNGAASESSSSACRGRDMDCLETCTNPIDRTVASLLFYKQDPTTDTTSGSVSPQSTITSGSSSCIVQRPKAVPHQFHHHQHHLQPLAFGNKLPLPPLSYRGGFSSSSKRGGRKHQIRQQA